MALFIASLNSGSNGNCYYVGNDTEAVFVDAGLSCRETERRMRVAGLDMDRVRAIFVSHEHADHVTGVPGISRKWNLPVYITPATHNKCRLPIMPQYVVPFRAGETITVGGLSILPFAKHHDGCDPHSFTISGNGVRIGVFTDIGRTCTNLTEHFSWCDAAFLEANYDEVMLDQGRYPIHLKNRIRGGKGHLSNKEAMELFVRHRSPRLSHLLLAHLSKENNHPELVESMFRQQAGNTTVVVASRYKPSDVYRITAPQAASSRPDNVLMHRPATPLHQEPQLALF